MKIEIYDPPMCCASGLCGPDIDPALITVNDSILALKKQGVEVMRFNLTHQPREFMMNKEVMDLLQKNGKGILPVTVVNGEVFKTASYPSYEEMCNRLGLEPLTQKPIGLAIK